MKEQYRERSGENQDRLHALSALRSSFTITQLQSMLGYNKIKPAEFESYLQNENFQEQVLQNYDPDLKDSLPFTQAILWSHITYEEGGEARGIIHEDNELAVDLFSRSWTNCTLSEDYLRKSLHTKRVLSINEGRLVVKPIGEPTAVCVETFATKRSTFVKGVWYSPVDQETRELIKEGFMSDTQTIMTSKGEWLPIRSVYTADKLLEDTHNIARNLRNCEVKDLPY